MILLSFLHIADMQSENWFIYTILQDVIVTVITLLLQ